MIMRRSFLTALFVTGLLGPTTLVPAAPAENAPWIRIEAWGSTVQAAPEAPLEGIVDSNRGEAHVSVVLLGPPVAQGDTQYALTSHTFTFEDGSGFRTVDDAVLSATGEEGVFRLRTRADILEGWGDFEGTCGTLRIRGTINFIPDFSDPGNPVFARATWSLKGKVETRSRLTLAAAGSTAQIEPYGAMVGLADTNLGVAEVHVVTLGYAHEEGGVQYMPTSHTFTFEGGSGFRTEDLAAISASEEIGLYRLDTHAEIVEGWGDFEGMCGTLKIYGSIDFIPDFSDPENPLFLQAFWVLNGRINPCE